MKHNLFTFTILSILLGISFSNSSYSQGNALDFDGVNDYVTFSNDDPTFDAGSGFTLEAWIRPDKLDGSVQHIAGINNDYRILIDGQNQFQLGTSNGLTISNVTDASLLLPLGVWTHIAATFSSGTATLYINGNQIYQESGVAAPQNLSIPFYLGGLGSGEFQGRMDEVRLWNVARSQSEIQSTISTELTGTEPALVAYYDFNQGIAEGNNAAVTSLQDVTGGLSGSLTGFLLAGATSNWVASEALTLPNNALDFDGVDDIIQVLTPTGIPLGAAPRTIEAWFTVEKDLLVDTEGAILQYGTPIFGQVFGLITSANDPGKFTVFDNTTNLVGTTTLENGVWYHVAVTYDGTDLTLYLNGQQEATKAVALNTVLNLNGLTIGERPGIGNWQGEIDEIRIWDVARTQVEIQSTITTELTGSESNLVAYYNFNEGIPGGNNGSVTTLPDGSTTNLNLTLNNFMLSGNTSNWIESTAFTPEIAVYLGSDNTGQELSTNQVIPVNYGNVASGSARTLTFAIENTSLFDLEIDHIDAGGDFTIISSSSFTIPPGTTTTFLAELDASSTGVSNDFIVIESNDVDEALFTFPVTGIKGTPDQKVWWTDEIGTFDDEIDRSNLDGSSFEPSYYSGFSVDIKGIVVDTVNNMVFWTNNDDGTIRCGRIGDTGFVATGNVLDQFEGTAGVVDYLGIAVDGVAGQLYWADATNGQIRRADFDGSNVTDLLSIEDPRDIALDIAGGKMYYVANPSFTPQLWRANLDGSDPELLVSSGSTFFNGVALDLVNDHVFWTESVGGVGRANLDGSNDIFVTSQVAAPKDIEVDPENEMMYIIDGSSIVRINYADDPVEIIQSGTEVSDPQYLALDTRSFSSLLGGVIPSDYEALVELYSSTGGGNWTDNTNWLSGNVTDWFGITVTGNRVTGIHLEANNLIGTIPAEVGNLSGVQEMRLSNNELFGSVPISFQNLAMIQDLQLNNNLLEDLPDLSGLTSLSNFQVESNVLAFDDVEPNLVLTGFVYAPQSNLAAPNDLTLQVGDELDVTITVGGTNNVYQWVKEGADLADETSANLNITNVALTDAGTYFLRITNTIATDLTLMTESFNVTVVDNFPPSVVYIFYINEESPQGTLIGSVLGTDPDGDVLTYSILSGNTNDALAIDAATGDVTVSDPEALDFETTPTFDLIVEANDGQGGVAIASVMINLIDVDENVLGIVDQIEGLAIYPNPVDETLNIRMEYIGMDELMIQLFALNGTEIPLTILEKTAGKVALDFTSYSKGIYNLKIAYKGDILSKNIIVK